MEGVGAALHGEVELAAGGVTELRTELVLQQREVRYGVGWNIDERTGHALIVVIHTLDGEVIVAGPLAAD